MNRNQAVMPVGGMQGETSFDTDAMLKVISKALLQVLPHDHNAGGGGG